jgi:hypothetical protein
LVLAQQVVPRDRAAHQAVFLVARLAVPLVAFPEELVALPRVAWVLQVLVLLVHRDPELLLAAHMAALPAVHPAVFLEELAAQLQVA